MEVLILFLISMVLFNYVHELGHHFAARLANIRVSEAWFGVGPVLRRSRGRDGTEYLYGLIPVASVRFDSDSWRSATPLRRLFTSSAGPLANFAFTFLLFAIAYIAYPAAPTATIDVVDENGVAASVGLRDGDWIRRVDGAETNTWKDVGLAFLARVGETGSIELQVSRHGEVLDYAVPIEGWQSEEVWINPLEYLGIGHQAPGEPPHYSPLAAVGAAFVDTIEMGLSTAANGIKMLFGTISVLNFGGGLQVAQLGVDSENLNVGDWLRLAGLFSLAFGIINLLPGPIVDGLAMLTAAAEWIAQRPIPDAAGRVVFIVGAIIAFGPIPLCIVHDLIRFTT